MIFENELEWEDPAPNELLLEMFYHKLPPSVIRMLNCKPVKDFKSLKELAAAIANFPGTPPDVVILPAHCGNCERVLPCPKCDKEVSKVDKLREKRPRSPPDAGTDNDRSPPCTLHGPNCGHTVAECHVLKKNPNAKRQSDKEEMKKKGLCFRGCGQVFEPGHKCTGTPTIRRVEISEHPDNFNISIARDDIMEEIMQDTDCLDYFDDLSYQGLGDDENDIELRMVHVKDTTPPVKFIYAQLKLRRFKCRLA